MSPATMRLHELSTLSNIEFFEKMSCAREADDQNPSTIGERNVGAFANFRNINDSVDSFCPSSRIDQTKI